MPVLRRQYTSFEQFGIETSLRFGPAVSVAQGCYSKMNELLRKYEANPAMVLGLNTGLKSLFKGWFQRVEMRRAGMRTTLLCCQMKMGRSLALCSIMTFRTAARIALSARSIMWGSLEGRFMTIHLF